LKDREQKYIAELARCRKNIQKTKGLIEYHRKMLKSLESKENEIAGKLEKVKMSSLCEIINKGGYDIDLIRKAVQNGEFHGISVEADVSERTAAEPSKTYENERKNEI
jgi:adenylylsulfate kinase-like enzyme